jgi:hypothetical protein
MAASLSGGRRRGHLFVYAGFKNGLFNSILHQAFIKMPTVFVAFTVGV